MKKSFILGILLLLLLPSFSIFAGRFNTITLKPGDSIQEAFDNVKDGHTIWFTPGLYETSETIYLKNKKNIKIITDGKTDIICTKYIHIMVIEKSSNITIDSFHMVHKRGAEYETCEGGNVLCLYDSENIIIKNCELNGCGVKGIYAYNSKNLTISDCYIHTNTSTGIEIYMSKGDPGRIELINNRVINNYTPILIMGNKIFENINNTGKLKMKNNTIYPGPQPLW